MRQTYYRWGVEGKPVHVEISLSVVEKLGGMTAVWADLCGVLLGRTSKQGRLYTTYIDDFEPMRDVPRRLEPVRGLIPVGLFRARGAGALRLDGQDAQRIEHLFRRPEMVYLLVQPVAGAPARACFFVQARGRIEGYAPLREFPFYAELLRSSGFPLTDGAGVPFSGPAGSKKLRLGLAALGIAAGAGWYGWQRDSAAVAQRPPVSAASPAPAVEIPRPTAAAPVARQRAAKRKPVKLRAAGPRTKAKKAGRVRRAIARVPGFRRFGRVDQN